MVHLHQRAQQCQPLVNPLPQKLTDRFGTIPCGLAACLILGHGSRLLLRAPDGQVECNPGQPHGFEAAPARHHSCAHCHVRPALFVCQVHAPTRLLLGQQRLLQFRALRLGRCRRLFGVGQHRVRQVGQAARRRNRLGRRVAAQPVEHGDPSVLLALQRPSLLAQTIPLQLRAQQIGLRCLARFVANAGQPF